MPKRTHDGIKKRCDCPKKQWPKCSHPWHFSLHFGGKEHRYSLEAIARLRNEPAPTSKAEAVTWRDRLRGEIRAGTFAEEPAAPPPTPSKLTFGYVCDEYLKKHVQKPMRRERGRREMGILIKVLRRAEIPAGPGECLKLEDKPIADITRADVEAVRVWRRQEQAAGKSRPGTKGGEAGTNRLLSRLRHVFTWAIDEGYLEWTPFKRGPVSVVKLESAAEGPRTRRLEPSMTLPNGDTKDGEEARLLKHAGPHLRALIVAALSTGCRLGELLSLQWQQIRYDEKGQARWILLSAEKTKTAEARTIPVGPRLRAELEMRRQGPDGKDHAADRFVFGNEVGERVTSIRTAWELTCERAGIAGLHFHDLRREFACRLLESSADLHDVRDFLGHANITTTSRYLQSTPSRLERVLARMEADGFAQDSHTATNQGAESAPEETAENPANRLN